MAHSPRILRIVLASFIAVLMVGGSFAFSGPNPLFGLGRIAEAQSSEELLREYAAKDTDLDGLPDWQEALYGTDPANPESFQPGLKDGEAVAQGLIQPKVTVRPADEPTDLSSIPGTAGAPNSLTDRFAQELLSQYLSKRGEKAPTSAEIVSFVDAGIQNLSAENAYPATFSLADVKKSNDTGAAALITYAAQAEQAFALNTIATDKDELGYFAEAMKGDDASLAKIADISKAYAGIANALMTIPVPAEARQAHLSIANALMRMSGVTEDMAAIKSDPVRALLGIGLYEKHGREVVSGFANLSGVFSARNVVIPEGTAGFFIVRAASNSAAAL